MYSASKAALNSLTANVRTDLRASHPGIHVTLVMPGMVKTDFAKNALAGAAPAAPVGAPPAGFPEAQSAEDVAEAIANVIEYPVAETFTNPAQAPMAARYLADVGAAEDAQFAGGK